MKRILPFLFCLACTGCPVPIQPPAPPTPVVADASRDLFTGQVSDCHGVLVVKERANSLGPVGDCIVSDRFPGCLTGLTTSFAVATVACVARDLGASANAAVLSGAGTAKDATTANNVRVWITSEKLGFE